MALDFDKFATKGNTFIKELAKELGDPKDTARAGRLLRSVLHALRDQLTVEENIQLLAQLPMFLKAVYTDSWSLHTHSKKARHLHEFYNVVRKHDQQAVNQDFKSDDDVDQAVAIVFLVLRKNISLGELEDIKAVLPKDLKILLSDATMI